jgi:hypothetical protein
LKPEKAKVKVLEEQLDLTEILLKQAQVEALKFGFVKLPENEANNARAKLECKRKL